MPGRCPHCRSVKVEIAAAVLGDDAGRGERIAEDFRGHRDAAAGDAEADGSAGSRADFAGAGEDFARTAFRRRRVSVTAANPAS